MSQNGSQGQSRTTGYSYVTHSNGLLATVVVDGPLSADTITYTYNPQGDLVEIRNALGQTSAYSYYNALGQPGRVTGPSGYLLDYGYDARGRMTLLRTYPNGSPVETNYVFGANGLLDAVVTGDGNARLYHYDQARRVIQQDVTSPGGGYEVRRTFYNAMSQPTRVEIGRDN